MPPIPLNHEIVPVEQLSLTDQDVELLHQIIIRAEEHTDAERLPFRAIFAAYDSVLSENGIEADKDRTYLRFLFALGDRGVNGEGLYAKFETLLAQLGIHLEYSDGGDDGGNAVPGADSHSDAGPSRNHAPIVRTNGVGQRKFRPRRASFNSIYDLSTEVTQKSINRPSSRLSESRLDDVVPSTEYPIQENTLLHAAVEHPQALRELAKRLLAGDVPSGNVFHPPQSNGVGPNAQNSGETHAQHKGEDHERAHSELNHADNHDPARDDGDVEELGEISSSEDSVAAEHLVPSEFFYQPSLSHLLRDASIFNTYRLRSAARQLFRSWSERAKENQHNAMVMEEIALRHDKATLLRQALDIWQVGLQHKRQEAQTERFFRHLEERAGRARDLYLLTKVFTHWGQVASDEMKRTSAARRHILSVKYFNAWRELTAINELKIQRFTMKKPFNLWIRRLRQVENNEAKAAKDYDQKVSKKFYWGLFWSFCYRRAPQWRDYRLKHWTLVSWLRNLRDLRDREHEVDIGRKRGLLQSAFQKWSQRSRAVALAETSADRQLSTRLMGDNFAEWRIQHHLRSASAQVSNMVKTRRLRSSFNTWASRTRLEIRAREVDRAGILRNAWTVWNDRLRYQALAGRIDERIVMQSLYKWVLMARFRLMSRIHQHGVKREKLSKLVMNSRVLYSHLLRKEEDFRNHRKTELVRQKFSLWRRQLEVQRQRDHMAKEFYAPHVEQDALEIWKSRHAHVNKMTGWAKDARFYFLTMTAIKQWHAAAIDSAKKREKNAYATVRRRVKVNMVTAALTSWRSQTAHALDLRRQADEMRQRSLVRAATKLFDVWVQETSRRVEHIRDSDTYYNRQLVYNDLAHWIGAFRAHRVEEEKATQVLEVQVSRLAVAQLRKLSLRLFQTRTAFETADSMNDRNMRKHFKNMVRHWNERARESRMSRIPQTPHSMTPAGPGNGYSLDRLDEEDEWQNADGTLNVDELVSQPNSAPHTPAPATPGYLNSPSKRAARARALAQMSTTPATPMRTPFATRLLSRGENTEPRGSSTKRTFVPKSALGATVRFAVEEEEEPESPTHGRMGKSYRSPS